MIWFFKRHHARLRYEIRRQTDGPNYELVITFPDGRQEIELYSDPSAVTERAIKTESRADGRGLGAAARGAADCGTERAFLASGHSR
jgi:hypothetical protein